MANNVFWKDINLFMFCRRCFYVKNRFNVKPPQLDSEFFGLANVVDKLRKQEADFCRTYQITLSIMQRNNVDAIPFDDEDKSVETWRKPFYQGGGITFHDLNSEFYLNGSIDDVFVNEDGNLSIVEFKSTVAKSREEINKGKGFAVNELQVSFYTWLLKNNGYDVHSQGYLIYSSAYDKALDYYPFQNKMYFKSLMFAVDIDFDAIEKILNEMAQCLAMDEPPAFEKGWNGVIRCQTCRYYKAVHSLLYASKYA